MYGFYRNVGVVPTDVPTSLRLLPMHV
jgi:hypothetical protein